MENNRTWAGTTSLAVIIPWRDSGDLERRANFDYVYNYYVRLDIGPVVAADDGVTSGPFNRSACYNRGMTHTRAGTYLWNEADAILPLAQIGEAVTLANKSPGNVIPFTERHELDPTQTQRVLHEGADPFLMQGNDNIFPDGKSIGQQGVTSIETIDRIGGKWDEGFSGWGYDDDAMHYIFATLAGPPRWIKGKGMHLYHQLGSGTVSRDQQAATNRNEQRYYALRNMTAEQLRQRQQP